MHWLVLFRRHCDRLRLLVTRTVRGTKDPISPTAKTRRVSYAGGFSLPMRVVAVRDTSLRRCQDSAAGLTAGYRLSLLACVASVRRLLCHGSNSGKVPLYRTTILTPQRLECASWSSSRTTRRRGPVS
jgi:hypothetical protein